jgi:excinuclease ABC subunit C
LFFVHSASRCYNELAMESTQIQTQLKALPAKPGVYIFKDAQKQVIYVGKATKLRHRVKYYFGPSSTLTPKIQQLATEINDLEFMFTNSEQEAFILENNLIKKFHPKYNVRLKDDKTYPYIRIDTASDYPGIYVTRRYDRVNGKYFGPFADAASVRKTLKLIESIFPFRSCNKTIKDITAKPCLKYHIHRCLGPCIGAINKQDYAQVIRQVILFLEGKQEIILKELKQKMLTASQALQFEKAAFIRDQIKAVEHVIEGQRIAVTVKGDQDVIAIARNGDEALVELFLIRNNKLIGRNNLVLDGIQDEEPVKITASFLKQYYQSATSIPPKILLQYPVDEPEIISDWLKSIRGAPVKLLVPQKGIKKQMIDMVANNAQRNLELYKIKRSASIAYGDVLNELKEKLHLPKLPLIIEGYDISNIQGTLAVGSMVVFENGSPRNSRYRRFKIKTITGSDDYGMMKEMLRRRFNNNLQKGDSWAIVPDMILIDGGKGHLNAALEVLSELALESIPVASLAKEREEVFIPGNPQPLPISRTSPALYLLQRIRDEAHRFALGYHQKLRQKTGLTSALDSVPGIGPKRKKALLKEFGSVSGIKRASKDDMLTVKGITDNLADTIKEHL